MPQVYADRVKESSTTTGTGTLTLAGAVTNFQSFAAIGDGNTVLYTIEHQSAAEWEVGLGTYTSAGTTLSRSTVLASSNAGAAVSFSAGTKHVWPDFPARNAERISTYTDDEISITTTATATIGRMHVCSGASAYTVTLPAASGNAGRRIAFRITATNLVTLDGNGTETIDGATTRIMWKGESCELYCDGSNWFKVAGETIPLIGGYNCSSTSVPVTTATKLTYSGVYADNSGLMISSSRINIKRAGFYIIAGQISINDSNNANNIYYGRFYRNGSLLGYATFFGYSGNSTGTYPEFGHSVVTGVMAVNDYFELYMQHYGANSETGTSGYITAVEIPSW